MRTIKKNGKLLHLLPLPSNSEGDDGCCPNCLSQFDPVKFRRAYYVACKHITCLECVINSKLGCDQCGDIKNGKKSSASAVINRSNSQEKEKEDIPKSAAVENGTCPVAPASPVKPAILSLVKKPVVVEEQHKIAEEENRINSCEEVVKCEPKENAVIVEENVKKEQEKIKVANLSTAESLMDGESCNGGDDCDIVFIKRKDAPVTNPLLTCSTCRWQLDTEKDLAHHRLLLHTRSQSEPEIIDVTDSSSEGSPIKQINRKDELKAFSPPRTSPRRMENGNDPPKEACKNLSLPLNIKKEKHPCQHCDKIFSTKLNLNCHLSLHHKSLRPHYCKPCGSSFQSFEEFQNHRKIHHPHGDRRYKCTKCESRYSQKYRLEQHVRLVHPPTTTIPTVNLSPRTIRSHAIMRKRVLKEAKKLDHSTRDYKCDICLRTFYYKSHKVSHLLNKHRIRVKLTVEDLAKKQEKGEEGKYCPECQSEFDEDEQGEHRMVAFSMCGHLCCLGCSIRDADLGCGQCTTETAPKTRFPSGSPSPMKRRETAPQTRFPSGSPSPMKRRETAPQAQFPSGSPSPAKRRETADRRRSSRMVMKPVRLRDFRDSKEVDEIIDKENDSIAEEEPRLRKRSCSSSSVADEAAPEAPRRPVGRPKGSLSKKNKRRKIHEDKQVIQKTEEVEEEIEPSPPILVRESEAAPRRGPGRPKGSPSKLRNQKNIKSGAVVERKVALAARTKLRRRIIGAVLPEKKENATKPSRLNSSDKNGKTTAWNCRFCNASYPQKRLLAIHRQKKHSDILPVVCHICQWSFHSRRDRDRHCINIHGLNPNDKSLSGQQDRKKMVKCEKCGKVFKGVGHLERHNKLHHSKKRGKRGPYKKRQKQQE